MTDLLPPEIDLQAALIERTEPSGARDGAWVIADDSEAEWAVRKLRRHEEKVGQHHAWAASQKAELDAAYEEELAKIRRHEDAAVTRELPHVERFYGALLNYLRQKIDETPDLKTYFLAGAQLRKRAGSKRLDMRDEAALVKYLEALPADDPQRQALKPATVLKTRLLYSATGEDGSLFTSSGELIPGVVQVVGEEKFDVKLEADEDVE